MDSHGPVSSAPTVRSADSPSLVAAARELSRRRLAFAIPATAVSFGGFILITALAGFTNVLNIHVFGSVSLLFVLLVLGFPVVGVCAWLYSRHAAQWDVLTAETLRAEGVIS